MEQYPYVVVRYMAAVYGHFPVRFVEHVRDVPGESTRAFMVVCARPFRKDTLTRPARQAVIEVVRSVAQRDGRSMCVVFAAQDCVYVEADGRLQPSKGPPSGGAGIRFPIKRIT